MYTYSSSISLVTHSLIHTLNQAIMHTYVTLEPQTSANQMRLQPEGKESMGLSRYHARLVRMKKKDGWMLVDNKSTNGTYVNSIKIAQLKPYVFFISNSHSHLFNKLEIFKTIFIPSISSYSLVHSQAHSSNYAHSRNARTTGWSSYLTT